MARRKKDGVFCIAVSWFHFVGIDKRVYEICRGPRDVDCIEITRAQACEIIDKNFLVKVFESEDGCIYDTPDMAFYDRWNGYFRLQREAMRMKEEDKMKQKKRNLKQYTKSDAEDEWSEEQAWL